MSISYLIARRSRPALFSKAWVKVWAKRVYTLPTLVKILTTVWFCRIRGGNVGFLTILEGTRIRGRLTNLSIGAETYIDGSVTFALHGCINIGSKVVINSDVKILTGSHDLKDSKWPLYSKAINIEDCAWIASDAIILPGVRIGRGAVVGAGAVVRFSVPANAIVIGNPASVVGVRPVKKFDYSPVMQSAPFEAWVGKDKDK